MFFFFFDLDEPLQSPALQRFSDAIMHIRHSYPELTIGQLATFFTVAKAPAQFGQHVTIQDIVARSADQKYPTIARQLEQLGEGTVRSPGMKLIDKRTDPQDRRNRHVTVSAEGKSLLLQLDAILSPRTLDHATEIDRNQA